MCYSAKKAVETQTESYATREEVREESEGRRVERGRGDRCMQI